MLLQRHALEVALKTYWSLKAPGHPDCSTRAQFLCLDTYLPDATVAKRAHQAWAAQQGGTLHPRELAPTREGLLVWQETVVELIDVTERAWL